MIYNTQKLHIYIFFYFILIYGCKSVHICVTMTAVGEDDDFDKYRKQTGRSVH